MRVVITGSSRAASFTIRGEQLGKAIGAVVRRNAWWSESLALADIIVLVKRAHPDLAQALRKCGRPVVWDALDFYDQRDASPREVMIEKALKYAEYVGASAIIGATITMAQDLESDYFLPHHGWDRGRKVTREEISVVAYEGAEAYLGEARKWIEHICSKHGARAQFHVNPPDYLSADVILAYRADPYETYATRHWKSGVKLSNAQIAGIPFVGKIESGLAEQFSGGELWFKDPGELDRALARLADPAERARRADEMFARAPRLEAVAAEYLKILDRVLQCGS